jgi:hypothetical protein
MRGSDRSIGQFVFELDLDIVRRPRLPQDDFLVYLAAE